MADLEEQKQIQDAERDVTKLWRAWRTVHEMCQDRVGALSYSWTTPRLIKAIRAMS